MGANNTLTTASSLSSGGPRRPMDFLNLKCLLLSCDSDQVFSRSYSLMVT